MKMIAKLNAPLKSDTLPKLRKGATAGLPINQLFAALRTLGWIVTGENVPDGYGGAIHRFAVTNPEASARITFEAYNAKELNYRPRYALLDWLKEQENFLPAISAHLRLPTLEAERAYTPLQRFSQDEATCPCCFGPFKVRLPAGKADLVMVLHGYRRPGHGSTEGQCFGVHYPPFEHSAEGTRAYRAARINDLAMAKARIAHLESGTATLAKEVRDPVTRQRRVVDIHPGEEGYAKALEHAKVFARSGILFTERHIAFLTKQIDRWVRKPLPSEGDVVESVESLEG